MVPFVSLLLAQPGQFLPVWVALSMDKGIATKCFDKKNRSLKLFFGLKKIINFTVAPNGTISKHINPHVPWKGATAKISEPGKLKER